MRLRCSKLRVLFRGENDAVEALRNVSFTTKDGEFLAVIGPSGCGKTTLLRVLAKLLPPSEGKIEYGPGPGGTAGRIALVFQEDGLFPWMTVLDNAVFGLEARGAPRQEREAKARELLRRFGLQGREQAYPHQLSVGMKQRVAVIRSFLTEPALLLMDEPFAALDAQTRLQLQGELLALWEQRHRTVIFVTHDVDEAILLSDRILVLSQPPGTVIAEHAVSHARPRTAQVMLGEEVLRLKRKILSQLGMDMEDPVHVV